MSLNKYLYNPAMSCCLLILTACSGDGGDARTEITVKKEMDRAEADIREDISTEQRLGLRSASNTSLMADSASSPGSGYIWEVPENWEDRGEKPMRIANLGLKGNPDVECSFIVLGGDGGGLAANLNRWRGQIGLEPYTEAEIDALPRKTFLGQEAYYTVMDGSYGGMSGQNARDNWRMIGLTLIGGGQADFVKMTGPADVVEKETENFLTFSESIKAGEAEDPHAGHDHAEHDHNHAEDEVHEEKMEASDGGLPAGHPPIGAGAADTSDALPDGHPPIGAGSTENLTGLPDGHPPVSTTPDTASAGAAPGKYNWQAPSSWEQTPDRPMREVTYKKGDAECYISELGGGAGGVVANINRWYMQMAQEPLTEDAIKALPTITVLGKQSQIVEIKGTFSGMRGGAVPDQMMLGVVCTLEDRTLFVKMIGHEDTVSKESGNFVAFCESITQ